MCRNVEWSIPSSITRCGNRALEIVKQLGETLPEVILWWPILQSQGQPIHGPTETDSPSASGSSHPVQPSSQIEKRNREHAKRDFSQSHNR